MRRVTYRRDAITWAAFGALFAFGFLNAVLGPALPYLRATEGISYVVGALHQVAFAVGGGVAGLLAARESGSLSRKATICAGLLGAAAAGLAIAYGDAAPVTIAAALLMSLFGTSALVRMWGLLADHHGPRRTVAMTEGEVSVSLAGIVTPLLIGALAATALDWRFAFVVGAAAVAAAAGGVGAVHVPAPTPGRGAAGPIVRRLEPTLIVVFAIVALEFSVSFWLASYLDDSVGLSRNGAVAMVSGLYAANLAGRLLASRLARSVGAARLLAGALLLALVGLPVLLAAHGAAVAALGIALAGAGIGAMFPLTSSLHVGASGRTADGALGEILAVASVGQIAGPLAAGAIAEAAGLRAGLAIGPALVLLAGAALAHSS
jgi:fucose permease